MVVVLNEVEFGALPPGDYDVEVWERLRPDADPERVYIVWGIARREQRLDAIVHA